MATRTDILRFFSGGISALIPAGDGSEPLQGTEASPAARPEETAPQIINQESFIQRVTQPQILIGTVILLGLIGVLAFARR